MSQKRGGRRGVMGRRWVMVETILVAPLGLQGDEMWSRMEIVGTMLEAPIGPQGDAMSRRGEMVGTTLGAPWVVWCPE